MAVEVLALQYPRKKCTKGARSCFASCVFTCSVLRPACAMSYSDRGFREGFARERAPAPKTCLVRSSDLSHHSVLCSSPTPPPRPDNARGEGKKEGGGGKTSPGDPPQKTVPDPHLGKFCPLPSISLSKSLRISQTLPQQTSETAFRGSRKMVSRRAILARFLHFASPLSSAQPGAQA